MWISLSKEVLGEIIEHNVPLNSALLYIVEGLVPLLSAFCKQLRSHSSAGLSGNDLLTSEIKDILIAVGHNLGVRYNMHTVHLMLFLRN